MLTLVMAIAMVQQAERTATTPEAPAAAARDPSEERIICRSRPQLGSRITTQRRCMTVWQWRIYEADMEQSRRDLNDRGMRGMGPDDGS